MRAPAVSLLLLSYAAACSDSRRSASPTAVNLDVTAAQAASFSGDATVIQANVLGLGGVTLGRAGPLPASGGAEESALLNASIPALLSARTLHAATVGQGDNSRAEASLANLQLSVAGISVSASFAMSRAGAACTNGTATAGGSAEVVGLVINGQAIAVTSQPNLTITLPLLGRVVINEQTRAGDGDITVNAIHVVATGADVVVSSAQAGISCAAMLGVSAAASECKDFVTGGGWITGTPSGARGNFGVAGAIKHDEFWGHLTYQDHGPGGPRVKGTGVTAYSFVDETTRHIEGTAEIDGVGGHTYTVDVSDNGEPGRNDRFVISLSNGYSASGNLDGGNIQLHKPCGGSGPPE